MEYSLGIDIGGTNISAGIVSDNGENISILSKFKIKTRAERPSDEVLKDISIAGFEAAKQAEIPIEKLTRVGVGCPGTCNRETGFVEYANNLHWEKVPLQKRLSDAFGKPIFFDNDANAAAFGEYIAGAARGKKSAVIITIGTGLGAGIIIDGKLFSGSNFAGGEIGHTVINVDGELCTCGRHGCFEAYSSATALVKFTKRAMEKNPESLMHELVKQDRKVSGRTSFNAAKLEDKTAQDLVYFYIKHLACGIANTINVFQPDVLCVGGGVSNEGENLLVPLKEQVSKNIYSKNSKKNTEIVLCNLGNNAGIIGAAMLGKTIGEKNEK